MRVLETVGRLYFRFNRFLVCGSNISEKCFILVIGVLCLNCAFNTFLIFALILQAVGLLYRGRLTNSVSEEGRVKVSFLYMMSFTQLLLLVDYAIYEQNYFSYTGSLTYASLSYFHFSLSLAQLLFPITLVILNEEDLALVLSKCKYLIFVTAIYCYMFGVGWIYRSRIAITYLLVLLELGSFLKFVHNIIKQQWS